MTPVNIDSTELDVEIVTNLFKQLFVAPTQPECLEKATSIADFVIQNGIKSLYTHNILSNIENAAKNKKSGYEREASLLAIKILSEKVGKPFQPFGLNLLPIIFELSADKGDVVREAADEAALTIIKSIPSEATSAVLEILYPILQGNSKWKSKLSALSCVQALTNIAPKQIANSLIQLLPYITSCMQDTKSNVAKAGVQTGIKVCSVIENDDILSHVPDLVGCMADPSNVPAVVKKLSNTTFVAEVTGPALAIMVPLLVRALSDRSPTVQRQAVIVVDNLCKLVVNPADAGQFLPPLWPGVLRIAEDAAFPQVREFGQAAKKTLEIVGGAETHNLRDPLIETKEILKVFEKEISSLISLDEPISILIKYVSIILTEVIFQRDFNIKNWKEKYVTLYLNSVMTLNKSEQLTTKLFTYFQTLDKQKFPDDIDDGDDDDGVDLCNVEFSLAYGGLMLLNHTVLRLKRGRRYAICGQNGAGKSTLLTSISKGKVDNFPPQSELRCLMVEVTRGSESTEPLVDTIANDPNLSHVSREQIVKALHEVGFNEISQQSGLSTLSGGWLMKLELAKAMLIGADLLLLDEPTNHLDVTNVKWLENWLINQKDLTCMIVSHDSSFLDNVATDIIHYETKKLVYYRGNLKKFVEKKPEAKTYYSLEAGRGPKLILPKPSHLVGVRSMTKAILKMHNCTYTYPGSNKPSVTNVSCAISLSSRIGIIGKNGAGKSTIMKLITGDIIPQDGSVDKHPNLRIGYVAQHAFHHLNRHPDKTPIKYIQWRYEGGVDKELTEKISRILTEEDKIQMNVPIEGRNGEKRKVESIIGRQKEKKSFKYEIKWQGLDHRFNSWLPRDKLLSIGFNKLVQEFDDFISSQEGLGDRDMSTGALRKLLEDIGLDGDIAEYNDIAGLSGGQKVKTVLAAAMIATPSILIMDEPTNYLDRDTLASLAMAMKDWSGGVVLISHNHEFIDTICTEQWFVDNGQVTYKGTPAVDSTLSVSGTATPQDDSAPVSGTSTPKSEFRAKKGRKKKSRNELKAQEVRRRLRYLAWLDDATVDHSKGKPPSNSSDEE